MNSKTTRYYLIGIILSVATTLCTSCKKADPFTNSSMDKVAQAELKSTSKPFGIELLLTGKNKKGIGFVGEVLVTARATNNTKYSFKKPVHVYFAVKGKNGPITDLLGSPVGATLVTHPSDTTPWKPGETITLLAHEAIMGKTEGILQFLTKTLNPPLSKPIDISASVDMGYVF
ncbi:MAG: hypothetical protein WCK75_07410 [Elusimicrobiota bacterium]